MRIAIVDDEKILAEKISKKLERAGFLATVYGGYREVVDSGDSSADLYVIDVSLGDGSGFDVIRWLRNSCGSQSPVIVISGYGDSQNVIYGLDLGADDYLTKPFLPDELVARVRAVLRRPGNIVDRNAISFAGCVLDTSANVLVRGLSVTKLTKRESLLLETFMERPGSVVSRDDLVDRVWGAERNGAVSDNTVSATLSNARKKLGRGLRIRAVYQQGYVLEAGGLTDGDPGSSNT